MQEKTKTKNVWNGDPLSPIQNACWKITVS